MTQDAFHLEFWNDSQHHLVTPGTFPDLARASEMDRRSSF